MRCGLVLFLFALALSSSAGCGGTIGETQGGTADFDRAKAAFDRGDYLDAVIDFKAYIEFFPGTERTDDALFYLGESYMHQKDYALASGQFDRLLRDFPASQFQPDALFELARCDDLQSRGALLDQSETERALGRYNQFLEQYPADPKAKDAQARIQALRDRLAEKKLRTGRLYYKLHVEEASAMSLRSVLTDFADSKWAPEAALLLADVLVRQGKHEEAIETLKRLQASVPEGEIRRRADERLRILERSGTSR